MSSRTMIFSPEAWGIERLLLQDARFSVLQSLTDGKDAYGLLYTLCPDFIVLDDRLAAQDAHALLRQVSSTVAAPPRVLFWAHGERSAEKARQAGADRILTGQEISDRFVLFAAQAAALPLPSLAQMTEGARLQFADALLTGLCVPEKLKGRAFMQHAAAMAACAPGLLTGLKYGLYPLLSERFHSSPAAIERCIRTAVEATWLSGDLNAIHRYFGFSVDAEKGKPTNSEFLSMLSEHVRRKTNHWLLNS